MSSCVPYSKINSVYYLVLKGLAEAFSGRPIEIRAKPFLRFANDYLVQSASYRR
jgi:hypothetical protein